MATTYTKKFKEFIQEWNPEGDDYIVGYRSLDDSEIRIPLLAVDNSITSNKYIRKDIDDYANGIIRFNKGFTVSSNVMSTIYLQGLNGWMGTQKGDFEMNSLTLREFLEVPELRKNKITVMGNQFWFTDSAMVKVANATGSGNYDIYFKLEEDEYAPFELNDILKGIYHYSNGFWTVYLKVYELILNPDTLGEIGVRAHAMNSRDPRQSMLLARINNSEDKERQGSIFADGLRRYIRVLYGYDDNNPTSEGSIDTLKVQMGDLSTITNHPIFGDLEGYGLYADNVYLTGKLIVKNDPNQPGQELGVYRGVWNATANYYKYDQVTYNGSLYTSKQVDNVGHIPTGTPDDIWWELTVSKGNDGTSGESNINLELTNDNHNIPTDSEGKNPSYGGAYSTAFVYQGTNDITDVYTIKTTLEAPVPASKLQFVQNDNTVTITHIADDLDGANIKFTATAEGYPTVSRIWGISKVKSGKPGDDATSYWLVTDTPVIKKHIYNVSGSEVTRYEPSPFVIRAFAQTGTDPIRQYSGYIKLTYGSQVQVVAGSTYQFTPAADVNNYTIELFQEVGLTTLLDKEIVTVVEDGKVPNWQTYIFKPSTGIPATPTYVNPPKTFPTPEGWYDYPNDSTSIWWMSTASINGVTNTVYEWSKPVKVTGEDGSDGANGIDGTWTDFKFAKNSNANTSPAIVVTDRNPAGWADTTPSIGINEYLWMTRAVINPNNTLKTNWSNPVRISGEKGDTGATGPQGPQGLHGVDGLQGPSIAFGGNWSASTQYYGYNTTQTCVYYGGKYYYTKTVSPELSPITIPSGDANHPASTTGKIYWNEFVGQFSNIATGLLLAERIATSELTANKLFIVDRQESTGNIIASDGSIITKEEEKNSSPAQIIGRLTTGWYMDQGVIRSIAVNTDKTPKLTLSKDGKITATGVTITGTVHFENGTIGSMQVFNDSTWTSTVNGPFPASTGFYYLRKNNGVTVTPQGHIIGKDYFLTGDSTQGPSVFIGDVYIPGGSVPGTDDSTLTSFLKLFNSLFERVLIGSQYMIKAKLPLFSIGELTAYGSDGMEVPSLWEGIPVDKVTIDMINGKLTVIGGTGGIKGIVLPAMTAEDALVGASLNSSGDTITFTKGTFATKSYVATEIGKIPTPDLTAYVKKAGDTMTGLLTLPMLAVTNGAYISNELYLPLNSYAIGATTRPRIGRFDRADGGVVLQLGTANVFDINNAAWSYCLFHIGEGSSTFLGLDNEALKINSTRANGAYIGYCAPAGTHRAQTGWHQDIGAFIQYTGLASQPTLAVGRIDTINDALNFRYNNTYYPVIHRGNLDYTKIMYWERRGNYNPSDSSSAVKIIETPDATSAPSTSSWHQYMNWGSGDANYQFQMSNSYVVSGNLYYRQKIGSWQPWKTIADNINLGEMTEPIFQSERQLDLRSFDSNTWYPCAIATSAYGGSTSRIVIMQGLRGDKPIWASHAQGFSLLVDIVNWGNGWGTWINNSPIYINRYNYAYGGETAFDGVEQSNMSSVLLIWLRGGARYYYWNNSNYRLTANINGYHWAQSGYTFDRNPRTSQLGAASGSNGGFLLAYQNGTIDWARGISSTNPQLAASYENNEITVANNTGLNQLNHAIKFRWHANYYQLGIIRDSGAGDLGFAICRDSSPIAKFQSYLTTISSPLDVAGRIGVAGIALFATNTGISSGNYNEGIRIGASPNGWSNINFYTANAWEGIQAGQWVIGRNPGNVFVIAPSGQQTSTNIWQAGNVIIKPNGTLEANDLIARNGLLYSIANGNMVVIGSQNGSWCHFQSGVSYHFDKSIAVAGDVYPYVPNANSSGRDGNRWNVVWSNEFESIPPSIISNWVNILQNRAAFNGNYGGNGEYVETNTAQLFARWQNIINGVGYRTTYAIGSYRGGSNYGQMTLSVCGDDSQTGVNGRQLVLGADGSMSWNGSIYAGATGSYAISTPGGIRAAQWFYSTGQTGWYNETYSGGMYMTSSDAVSVYNDKVLYNAGSRVWGIGGHNCGLKLYNANHIGINLANNSCTWGIYSNSNGGLYFGRRNGNVNDSSGSYYMDLNAGGLNVQTNIISTMEITAYSDIRLKSNISNLSFRGKLTPKTYIKDGKQSIGFIAQEVQQLYPELILIGSDENHYLSLNYGNISAVLAAQLNLVDDEVEVLKRKVQQLEQEIIILKNQNEHINYCK